jgi:hypothetical protein
MKFFPFFKKLGFTIYEGQEIEDDGMYSQH